MRLAPSLMHGLNLGSTLYELNRLDEADRALRDALVHNPQSIDANELLAQVLAGQDRYDEATKVARQICALNPDAPSSRVVLAGVLAEADHLDEALKEAKAAADVAPSDPRPHSALGAIYVKMNDGAAALAAFERMANCLEPQHGARSTRTAAGGLYELSSSLLAAGCTGQCVCLSAPRTADSRVRVGGCGSLCEPSLLVCGRAVTVLHAPGSVQRANPQIISGLADCHPPAREFVDTRRARSTCGRAAIRSRILRRAAPRADRTDAQREARCPDASGGGVLDCFDGRNVGPRGRRYKNSRHGISVFDGPFIESKELIGGYVVVSAESLEDAGRWARLYLDAVEGEEVDVRELE